MAAEEDNNGKEAEPASENDKKDAGKETDSAPETVKEKKESGKDTAVPDQNADNTADSCTADKEKEA